MTTAFEDIRDHRDAILFTHEWGPRLPRKDNQACLVARYDSAPNRRTWLDLAPRNLITQAIWDLYPLRAVVSLACSLGNINVADLPDDRWSQFVQGRFWDLPWGMNDSGKFTEAQVLSILDHAMGLAKRQEDTNG